MENRTIPDDNWNLVVERLGGAEALEASARKTGALKRVRKVRNGEDLLRLCLAYGPGDKSLRSGAAWAAATDIASLSDVALLKRLRNCPDWLQMLLGKAQKDLAVQELTQRPVRLLDGSIVQKKGKDTGCWRIHSVYDLQTRCFSFFNVTDEKTGEHFDMAPVVPGEIRIGDRAYMQADRMACVLGDGGDVLVRSGWKHGRWLDESGEKIDLVKRLLTTREARLQVLDMPVMVGRKAGKTPLPLRLVAIRKPREARKKAEKAARKIAKKKKQKLSPNTLEAAGWLILVTSLESDEFPAETLSRLYRLRWQIELAFKRLKSLVGTKQPPCKDARLAKVFILAHLLLIVIIMPPVEKLRDSPPWTGQNPL